MELFLYKAVDQDGKKVSGEIEADSELDAVRQIRRKYPIITKVRPKDTGDGILAQEIGGKKLDKKELTMMCSQFAVILKSGVPIDDCMLLVSRQIKDKKLQNMLKKSSEDIRRGNGIADSFERNYPDLPQVFLETLRAGETSGNMEYAFQEMAKYYEKSYKTGQKIQQALSYPIFVLVIAIVVLIVMMVYVVPTMTATFNDMGGDLPMVTKILIGFSTFMRKYLWIIIFLVVGTAIAFKLAVSTPTGKLKWGEIKLRIPALGKIQLMDGSAQFASTMSTLLKAGLTLGEALEIVARVMTNEAMKRDVEHMAELVQDGHRFTEGLQSTKNFPDTLKEMCGIGEETGEMESTLTTVSEYFDNEVENATKKAIQMIEPTIMILMAVFAGFIVLSIYMPMFMMYDLM